MKIGRHEFLFHPIAVHFTNALFPVSLLFLALSFISPDHSFRDAYGYTLTLGALSAPFSYLTGIADWRHRYKGAKTDIFSKKLRSGIALIIAGVVCAAWYWGSPPILDEGGVITAVFLGLNAATLPLTIVLGHLGGRLVFMSRG